MPPLALGPVPEHTPGMGVNIAYARVGRVLCCVHSMKDPTDLEWTGFLACLRECEVVFVYSIGGGPNAKQRKQLADTRSNVPVAVITASKLTQAIGVAVRWFNPQIVVHAPGSMGKALSHLKLTGSEGEEVVALTRRLATDLGIRRGDVDLAFELRVRHAS
jgi:hypothetical protein